MAEYIHENDWQSGRSLAECNKYMLMNQKFCDVTFIVGENRRRMSAHKYVLVSRSSVFDAMFCGPLAEKDAADVEIPDVPEEAFKNLISYMYCGEVEVTPESALSVLYAAKKYSVSALENLVVIWLEENIIPASVCTILNSAIFYNESRLTDKCLCFMDIYAARSLASEGFHDLTKESLMKVLCRDSLSLTEEKIFEATMEWSKAECNRQGLVPEAESQRRVLGGAIFLIRFPLMRSKYIAQHVKKSAILSIEEIVHIFLARNGEVDPNLEFSLTKRAQTMLKVYSHNRTLKQNLLMVYNPEHSIRFNCDKSIILHGVILYGSQEKGSNEVEVCVTIGSRVAGKPVMLIMESSGGPELSAVKLLEGVHVAAQTSVEMKVKMCGRFYSSAHQTNSTAETNGYTFTFAHPGMYTVCGYRNLPGIIFSAEE